MAADSDFCGHAHIGGGGHRSNFPRAVAVDMPCSTPATKERGLTGAFFCKADSQEGAVCHIVPRACLPPIFSCVGSWFSKVADADPDDCLGDFESMMHLYACVGWLASLHDWPCASSLRTSDEPAPMQFPRPQMFNVDLSVALPLTVSDLRGVVPRASRSVALSLVCHGFHEPSRACPGEEVEAELPDHAAVPLLRPVWSGGLRMPLHHCGMNCSLCQAECGRKLKVC